MGCDTRRGPVRRTADFDHVVRPVEVSVKVSSLKETYESLNLEPKPIRPHILAAATVAFGEDYYAARKETINLSGFVQLNKWPMPGFEHKVDEQGYAEFNTELISAPEVGIKGFSYELVIRKVRAAADAQLDEEAEDA